MRLLNRQLRTLSLAGTVGLPAPFPAVGRLYLVLDDEDETGGMGQEPAEEQESYVPEPGVGDETLLKIVHEVTPKITIIRYVRFSDVSAIFLPDDPSKVDFNRGAWYLEKDLLGLALSCLIEISEYGDDKESPEEIYLTPRPGIVFVPESAKVLLQVELGMTAAESVEYYPPHKGQLGVQYPNIAFCEP
jgi:hypothetical protein